MPRIFAVSIIVFASLVPLQLIWNLADIFTGTLATLNIFVLFKLSKIAIKVLNDYLAQRKDGKEPIFYDDIINEDTSYWKRNR